MRRLPRNPPPRAATTPAVANVATATRATEAPIIDGDVLGDPAWAQATPITTFWQEQPNEGQPASERTEVRVVFTADTLYIGAVLLRPRSVGHHRLRRAPRRAARRHRQLPDDLRHLPRSPERVRVRHQSGRHRVRRPGHQRRAGRRRARRRPDAVRRLGRGLQHQLGRAWKVRAKISEHGWSRRVRHSVPHAALSRPATAQTWGINFQRNIRRRNERAYWAPIPRQFNLYRVSLAGIDQRRRRRRRCATSASRPTCSATRSKSGVRPVDTETDYDVGGDVKYSVTPSLTLDAHHQHRLRPGRGRRSAGQPRSLHAVLPREAAVLPRERRLLLGRQSR